MARVNVIQTNFSGGEIDPELYGRVETGRYKAGAARLRNVVVKSIGGARRHWGSRFVADEGAAQAVRLIPWQILRTDVSPRDHKGYIVELRADGKIRFYVDGAQIKSGGNPVEITGPYEGLDLRLVTYDVHKGVLHLWHPQVAPQQITRASDTSWSIAAAPITTTKGTTITNITRSSSTATVTCPVAHGLATGDKVKIQDAEEVEYNGIFTISVTSTTVFTYTLTGTPATPASGDITYIPCLRAVARNGSQVNCLCRKPHGLLTGQWVTISGAVETDYNGTWKITKVNGKKFRFDIGAATPTTPATGDILYTRQLWSDNLGYPACGTFFEQREIMASTTDAPHSAYISEVGDIDNQVAGTLDSDPMEIALAAARSDILHMTSGDAIAAFSRDRIITIQGGQEKALAPSNVQAKARGKTGCGVARPVEINEELVFTSPSGKKILAFLYDFTQNAWKVQEVSMPSGHLCRDRIVELAYQQEPDSIVWALTAAGNLISLTYCRELEVLAMASHSTDGAYKSIAVVRQNGDDVLWAAVERQVGEETHTFMEYFAEPLQTHAAYVGTDEAGKAVWDGLTHLEGQTVDILADGIVMPQGIVTDGAITLPRAANTVEIGLHYESEITDLPIELQLPNGTAQGQAISVHWCAVRLHESIGCTINGQVIPFRKFGPDVLDQPVQPFTGDKAVSLSGWGSTSVTIKQTQPLPLHVLAIIKKVTVND